MNPLPTPVLPIYQGGENTHKEIFQQPELWEQTIKDLVSRQNEISQWIKPFVQNKKAKIIFTGAGSSAYAGESIALSFKHESVPTTDLVAYPNLYLHEHTPTLLVSFARSGNSPESIHSVDLSNRRVKNIKHLIFTCNPNGELYKKANGCNQSLAILMPEGSDDVGFAMTSSLTCMMLSSLICFSSAHATKDAVQNTLKKDLTQLIKKLNGQSQSTLYYNKIASLAALNFNRAVFLGGGLLKAWAKESALKLMELTNGQIASLYETPMGFRHGPKTFVSENTLIAITLSDLSSAQPYELDLLFELLADGHAQKVIAFGSKLDLDYRFTKYLENQKLIYFELETYATGDMMRFFESLITTQWLAYYKSSQLNIEPDNPCPTGMVNRVVKGVKLYYI